MNCRHHHCRVLTVGEYVRIYDAAMGGPCPFVAGRWEHAPISRRCLKCGVQVALGPSDETPVVVEVRAAEVAADYVPDLADALAVESDDEAIGWALHRDATTPGHGVVGELHEVAIVDGVPRSAAAESGWLAREIYDALHDIEQGESI